MGSLAEIRKAQSSLGAYIVNCDEFSAVVLRGTCFAWKNGPEVRLLVAQAFYGIELRGAGGRVTPDPRVPYQKPDAGIVTDGAMPYWVVMPSGANSVMASVDSPTPGVEGGEPVGRVSPPALTPVA
jgi:hypothetical protein